MFRESRKQTVSDFTIPFMSNGSVRVLVMNVFGSTTKQSVSGIDEKASEMVNAMVDKLEGAAFTILDLDVYPDPSVKGVTGAPCYKVIFKVK